MKLLGKTVCFLLRRHKWRRMRKGEDKTCAIHIDTPSAFRICGRCGVARAVKSRAAK